MNEPSVWIVEYRDFTNLWRRSRDIPDMFDTKAEASNAMLSRGCFAPEYRAAKYQRVVAVTGEK